MIDQCPFCGYSLTLKSKPVYYMYCSKTGHTFDIQFDTDICYSSYKDEITVYYHPFETKNKVIVEIQNEKTIVDTTFSSMTKFVDYCLSLENNLVFQ